MNEHRVKDDFKKTSKTNALLINKNKWLHHLEVMVLTMIATLFVGEGIFSKYHTYLNFFEIHRTLKSEQTRGKCIIH